MNPGQEQFYHFIMERVHEEHKDTVKEMMSENFKKQENGTFTREDMQKTQDTLMKMLKPEATDEVRKAMAHFASQMK